MCTEPQISANSVASSHNNKSKTISMTTDYTKGRLLKASIALQGAKYILIKDELFYSVDTFILRPVWF